MSYYAVDALRLIEKQSGFLRLIHYLYDNGETQITGIMENSGIPIHQLYSSIEKGQKEPIHQGILHRKERPV